MNLIKIVIIKFSWLIYQIDIIEEETMLHPHNMKSEIFSCFFFLVIFGRANLRDWFLDFYLFLFLVCWSFLVSSFNFFSSQNVSLTLTSWCDLVDLTLLIWPVISNYLIVLLMLSPCTMLISKSNNSFSYIRGILILFFCTVVL